MLKTQLFFMVNLILRHIYREFDCDIMQYNQVQNMKQSAFFDYCQMVFRPNNDCSAHFDKKPNQNPIGLI
jgi:hypothetical protein